MCITSISKKECFRLILKPQKNIFIHKLPSATDIFSSLEKDCKMRTMWISDLLPCEYVYKPLVYDLIDIHTDDEYKVLKRIKQAKYVHNSIWTKDNRANFLIQNVLAGEIVIEHGCIKPAFYQNRFRLKKEIHPEYHNPIVYNIDETERFEVFFGSDLETKYNICRKRIFEIAGNRFEIVSVESIVQNASTLMVLQSDGQIRENYKIEADSKSVFRVRYDMGTRIQYIKSGSVIDKDDCTTGNEQIVLYPYVTFMEE